VGVDAVPFAVSLNGVPTPSPVSTKVPDAKIDAATVHVNDIEAVPPLPSLAVTETVNGEPDAVVGVPLITPVVELIVNPGGKFVAE
jgi:hypothetical protein